MQQKTVVHCPRSLANIKGRNMRKILVVNTMASAIVVALPIKVKKGQNTCQQKRDKSRILPYFDIQCPYFDALLPCLYWMFLQVCSTSCIVVSSGLNIRCSSVAWFCF